MIKPLSDNFKEVRVNRFYGLVIGVVSVVLNWFIYYRILAHFGSSVPAFLATVFVVSIVVHELCHVLAMEAHGIKAFFFLAVILGGAVPYPNQTKKYEGLPWSGLAAIAIAGVLGNFAVIGVATLLYLGGFWSVTEFLAVVNLNAGLILFNVLPLGILDGGRFTKVLFDSVPERQDFAYVRTFIAFAGFCIIAVAVWQKQILLLPAFLLVRGLIYKAKEDDPAGSWNRKAMRPTEQRLWGVLYVVILCVSILLVGVDSMNWLI